MYTLLTLELAMVRNWFARGQAWAKVLVILSFFLVIGLAVAGSYFFSLTFFSFVFPNEETRQLMVEYLLRSTLVVLMILSFSFNLLGIFGRFGSVVHRIMKPLAASERTLFFYGFAKDAIGNAVLMIVLGTPLFAGLAQALSISGIVPRAISVMALLAIGITATSTLAGFFGVRFLTSGRQKQIAAIVGVGLLMIGLRFFVVPPALFTLTETKDLHVFGETLGGLPVMNVGAMGWITAWMLRGDVPSFFFLTLVVGIAVLVALVTGMAIYRQLWQIASEHPLMAGSTAAGRLTTFPVFWSPITASGEKEYRWYVRSSSQLMYTVFIGVLTGCLILLLRIPETVPSLARWRELTGFVAFQFLLLTLWMRIVYPLFSQGVKSCWLAISTVSGRPVAFWGTLLWCAALLLAALFSLAAVTATAFPLFVSTAIAVLGIVFMFSIVSPNFEEDDPGLMSTSTGGISATIAGILCIALAATVLELWPSFVPTAIAVECAIAVVSVRMALRRFSGQDFTAL